MLGSRECWKRNGLPPSPAQHARGAGAQYGLGLESSPGLRVYLPLAIATFIVIPPLCGSSPALALFGAAVRRVLGSTLEILALAPGFRRRSSKATLVLWHSSPLALRPSATRRSMVLPNAAVVSCDFTPTTTGGAI